MNLKIALRILSITGLLAVVAGASAQSATVASKFGVSPANADRFTINLVNQGSAAPVAGFAFKLKYDPTQVEVTGVKDNTGQAGAKIQYTLGKASAPASDGLVEQVLTATTLKNLENPANLVEISLSKKSGYSNPLRFSVADHVTEPVIDGLTGADMKNIPHSFDSKEVNK